MMGPTLEDGMVHTTLEVTATGDSVLVIPPRVRRVILELDDGDRVGGMPMLAPDRLDALLADIQAARTEDEAGDGGTDAEQLRQMVRYLRTVDPSDSRPGEAPADMLRRIVEFYRGSGNSRFEDED